MKHTIIFHGTHGSAEGNWFPWLKKQLKEHGEHVYVPDLPTPEKQSVQTWMAATKEQLPFFTREDDITIIGHSCGATFLLHYLEQMEIKAQQSVFLSPVMDVIDIEEYDALNATFIDHEFDWDAIKRKAGEVQVLHGSNDPYVPITQAHLLSSALGVETTVIKNGGHLNAESGYTSFPYLLDIISVS